MHSEWDLLCIAEDIEQGDLVLVEDDNDSYNMIFVRVKGGNVLLKDDDDEIVSFSASTLEENEGYRTIVGKAEEE